MAGKNKCGKPLALVAVKGYIMSVTKEMHMTTTVTDKEKQGMGQAQAHARARAEVARNWKVFQAMPAEWVATHRGRIAMFSKGKLVDIYNDIGDAYKIGCRLYGLGNFSLQRIGAKPIMVPTPFRFLGRHKHAKDNAQSPASMG